MNLSSIGGQHFVIDWEPTKEDLLELIKSKILEHFKYYEIDDQDLYNKISDLIDEKINEST